MKKSQKEHLMNCEYLMSAHIEDNDVKNMNLVPFVVRTVKAKENIENKSGDKKQFLLGHANEEFHNLYETIPGSTKYKLAGKIKIHNNKGRKKREKCILFLEKNLGAL